MSLEELDQVRNGTEEVGGYRVASPDLLITIFRICIFFSAGTFVSI